MKNIFATKYKELKFKKPILTVYPHIANIFAMMENNDYLLPTVVTDMLELVYDKEIDRLDFSISLDILQYMNNYPLMYNHGVSRSLIASKWKKYSDFVIDMLNDGYYVHNLLDTYYISAYRETHNREHYTHNSMIYGYDARKEVFILADAFEKGVYESRVASFAEINNAFSDSYVNDWLDGIRLYKLKEDPFVGIGYNGNSIKEKLNNYLESKPSLCVTSRENQRRVDLSDRFVNGINVYDEVVRYMDRLNIEESIWDNADVRIFYLLYDHAVVYEYLIKQLTLRNQLLNCDELYKANMLLKEQLKDLCMKILRYNLTGKTSIADKIKTGLMDARAKDIEVVHKLLASLDIEKNPDDLSKTTYISANSIFMEYDDRDQWIRRNAGEDIRYTDKLNASVRCQFFGDKILIKYKSGTDYGKAQVYIDNIENGIIDYSDESQSERIVSGLDAGYHIVKLVNITEAKTINIGSVSVIEAGLISDLDDCSTARRVEYHKGIGGNLIGEYGGLGYDIVCGPKQMPEYITTCNYRYKDAITVLLMHNSASSRGVRKDREEKNNVAAYLLNPEELSFELTIPGAERKISLYMVDYDNLGRRQRVIIENCDTGTVYDTCDVEDFARGDVLSYRVKGHVRIRLQKVEGPDAVVSAVYFD